jgi:nucleotide-binding universal stress UspA family protein
MSTRVLVGTDGSSEAQVALSWAASYAAKTHGDVSVVTAWQPPSIEVDLPTHDEQIEAARVILEEQWCAPLRGTSVAYQASVLEGDPREVLLVRAAEEDADLVVVGARGSGGSVHPIHMGSVTHHLVHHTDRPLAAIPPQARTGAPSRIVVGVDGSPSADGAVEWCANNAPRLGADVVAVFSERILAEWVPRDDPRSWYQHARRDCAEWAAPLREAGVLASSIVREFEPVTGLLDAASHEDADLVVVGTRGRGGFAGLRLGSTALKVLHRSGLPVVLVPPVVPSYNT